MTCMIRLSLLADTPATEGDPTKAILPATMVIVALVVLILVFQWMRKRTKQLEMGPPAGFTLSDLRQLVKDGKMTPEEFERAKNKVLDATKRSMAVKPAAETVVQKETRVDGRGE